MFHNVLADCPERKVVEEEMELFLGEGLLELIETLNHGLQVV